ncbi:MAG: hypothetical protein ACOYL6_07800 [Bacteriovoracaceae bacterium]
MKNLSLKVLMSLVTMGFILAGCDAPSGGRARSRSLANTVGNSISSSGTNFTNGSPTTGSTTTTTTNTLGAGYENCDLSITKSTAAFSLGICQNTNDESKIKVKFVNTDTSVMTCFVPTYKSTDGSSIYLGQAQCTFHTAGQVMDGTFVKNRSGYSQAIINGVMIMKQPRLLDYYGCMDAIPNFIANNCPSQPNYCMTAAVSFRDAVCGSFVSAGNYLDIRLK